MKKFLVVLLALGLIVAFSAPAAAADVKFSGSYYVAGWYNSNQSLQKDAGSSNAFYSQRLRVQTVFQVAEGLKLTTRFDAMERVWAQEALNATTNNEQNIQWERVYVTFNTLGGTFDVGYQSGGTFGTIFADQVAGGVPRIKYTYVNGPLKVLGVIEKGEELDKGTTCADKDYDKYIVAPIYKWDGGNAGILIEYLNDARKSHDADGDYKAKWWLLDPYFKATFGPVYVEGEFLWKTGKKQKFEAAGTDEDYNGKSAYLMAKVDLGQVYVGGQVSWVEGDDNGTTDKDESGWTGQDYNPCLILFGEDAFNKFGGNFGTYDTTGDTMTNAYLYQVFAGFKPLPKLDTMASFTLAKADEKGTNVDDDYGTEFDITATYKIYDNLSYMIGFGYLWAGDFYKGTVAANKVDDNYMVMNKLTLTF